MEYFVDLLADIVRALTPMRVRKWIVKQKTVVYILYSILVYIIALSLFGLGVYWILRLCIFLYYSVLYWITCLK